MFQNAYVIFRNISQINSKTNTRLMFGKHTAHVYTSENKHTFTSLCARH